jgi:hypothetical protein
MKSCNKIREAYGLKILVNEETYNEYKGTYEEQIEELQDKIDKAIKYIESDNFWHSQVESEKRLLDILKGSEENDK